ncbi:thioredoxin family protein [Flagellimonas sp. 2504JD1-5]
MKLFKILSLLALVVLFGAFSGELTSVDEGYDIGDVATDFALKNTDGKMVSLSHYNEAKGFLVIFTCNGCPYSVAYEDRINALDAKYKAKGVPVIAINPSNATKKQGESLAKMKIRAAEKGFTFPYLLDEGQQIYPQYGATKTPHVFLLEKMAEGNIVRYIGAIDDNYQSASRVEEKYVENAVDAMLAGKEIKVTKTRAIGCTIKA